MEVGQNSRNNRRSNKTRSSSKKGTQESTTVSERNTKLDMMMRPQKFAKNYTDQELLLRKVRSILNIVSPVNYHRLRKRWLNLIPTNVEQVGEIVQLVVCKALDDTQYMCIYARLMGVLVSRRGNSGQKIRSLLSTQIHQELKKLATDKEIARFHQSMEQEWVARRKKVALHRLVAELYVENAISSKFLMERIADIVGMYGTHPEEADEALECLCVVLTFAGQKLEGTRKEWMDEIFCKLNLKECEKLAISKRIQFMVLDLLEMRTKSWEPHNKWWIPSVQVHTFSSADSLKMGENSLKKTDNMYLDVEDSTSITPGTTASRQRAETKTSTGSGRKFSSSEKERERTLQGILNKVSPNTLSLFSDYFPQVLPKHDELLLDISVDIILRKIVSEPSYVPLYVRLISHAVDTSLEFEKKVKERVTRLTEENLTCLGGIRLLAELFNADIISYHEIQKTINTLLLTTGDPCLESLCNLVFLTGKKLDLELKDTDGFESWLNTVMEQLKARANICTNFRLRSFILDLIDLGNNYWSPVRSLNYINSLHLSALSF